jgi:hypothetical protein
MPPQQSHGLLDLIGQMLDLGTHAQVLSGVAKLA